MGKERINREQKFKKDTQNLKEEDLKIIRQASSYFML